MKEARLGPPAIIVVGEVVKLREKTELVRVQAALRQAHRGHPFPDQASVFVEMLIDRGASPIEFPSIDVVPPTSWAELDSALDAVETYQWVIFTSANAVRFFFERLRSRGTDLRVLKGVNICAVGPKTAEALEQHGLKADLIPAEFKAEGVLTAPRRGQVKGLRFLIPRAKVAREIIRRSSGNWAPR